MSDIFGIGEIGGSAIDAGATIAAASIQAGAIDNATDAQRDAFNTITTNNKPFLNTGTSALGRLAGIYGLDTGTPQAPGGASGTPNGSSQPTLTWSGGTQGAPGVTNLVNGIYQQAGAFPNSAPGATGPSAVTPQGVPISGGLDPNGTFYQSPDYAFRFGQGIRGVDAGAAARGMLDSGATRKAEIQYAGNLASGEFNSYANRLQALAGIGQAAASNQASAAQGYANNIGNLAAAGANNWGNAINNVAGQFGSSYGSNRSGGGYSSGGINGIFSTGGTFGPKYTGDGNGEFYGL